MLSNTGYKAICLSATMSLKQMVVVDFSSFERRKSAITDAVMQAAESEGVFYVKNHGISQKLIDTMFARSAEFFKLDDVVKKQYCFDKPRNAGWEKMAQVRGVVEEIAPFAAGVTFTRLAVADPPFHWHSRYEGVHILGLPHP